MTLQSRELLESRRMEGDLAEPRRAYTIFRVWDTESGATITPFSALSAPGVPQRGDPHPSVVSMLADRFVCNRTQGDTNLCELEWEYVPEGEFYPGPGPGQDGYVVVGAASIKSEPAPLYRVNPSLVNIDATGNVITDIGQFPDGLWTDIGGEPVDVGGTPQDFPYKLMTVEVMEHRSGPLDLAVYESFINVRNSDSFATIVPNRGLYLGCQTVTIGPNMWAVNHTIAVDPFMHLIQLPATDQDNKVITVAVSTPNPNIPAQKNAAVVTWRQMFPLIGDFHLLSPHFGGL